MPTQTRHVAHQGTRAPAASKAPSSSTIQRSPSPARQSIPADKVTTRVDPSQVAKQDAAAANPEMPKQVGLSSSELNTATSEMKAQAAKEAETLPTNTNPKEGAPSDRQAASAEKKFQKEHE